MRPPAAPMRKPGSTARSPESISIGNCEPGGRSRASFGLADERIFHLRPIAVGHLLRHAIIVRPAARRQVERAEELVEKRQVDSEVHVHRLLLESMMPVVESRSRDPVTEAVEIAPDIGVEKR